MGESESCKTCVEDLQQQLTKDDQSECDKGVNLSLKYTSPSHIKLFGGCVPLHGLRRSVSSPRQHSPRTPTTPTKHPELCPSHNLLECTHTDSAFASTIGAPGVWEQEGSFNWKRVTAPTTVHHTMLSGTKLPYLGLRRKHTSLSDSNDFSHSLGLSDSPATSSSEAHTVFRDPMLEELDVDLPDPPPPPPRAFPPWLKLALMKQQTETSSSLSPLRDFENTCTRLACSQTSVAAPTKLTGSDKTKSCSLDHNRYGLRIYPVMQNGVKISDTHYWLLDPPQSFSARRQVGRPKCPSAENAWTPPSSPPPSYPETGDYLNVPLGVNLRREKSEPSKQALNNIHHQMAVRLLEQVPEATEAECQAVLIGTSYQYDEAIRRLKLELLCRKDYLSRSHCKRLLHKLDWDLQRAINCARLEYESRCVRRLGRDESGQNFTTENIQSPPPPPPRTGCTLDVFQLPQSPISPNSPVSPVSSTRQNSFFINQNNPFVDKDQRP